MLTVSLDCPFSLPRRYSLTFICPVSCLYRMLTVSLYCLFSLPLRYYLTFICPVSCVYPMLPVSLECPFSLPLRYSLTFIFLVSCAPYVASFSGFSFFITPSVFSNMYLSCVLCTLCCQFLWIVHFWLSLRYSLTFLCAVSCLPYVASFSGLYIFDCPFGIL